MILGIGSDIVDIRRVEKLLSRFGARFEGKLFTEGEIARADARGKGRSSALAKRFAAKEACAKALGTGIGASAAWHEIAVANNAAGMPSLLLSGNALRRLERLTPQGMVARLHVSLADEYPFAQAFVVISAVHPL